jgi:exosortase
MIAESRADGGVPPGFRLELERCWRQLPDKLLFFALLAAWVLFFQFWGNCTLGYARTPSLFGWLENMYRGSVDDEHGRLIPLVVLFLFWWKRKELLAVPKRRWWPAAGLLLLAVALQILSFMVQQTQISAVAFFVGLYALMGLTWGPQWLRASFFPFFLFVFCVPMANLADGISFPLRLLATHITSVICHVGLGINVLQDGTRLFDPNGAYQYEVAAACSGIRSLLATFALATIYAFVMLKTPWRRLLVVFSAFPLAVASNVIRLTSIIVSAEAFGQSAGNYVHKNGWLSLLPYAVAMGGIWFVGRWLREDRTRRPAIEQTVLAGAELNS